MLNLTINESDSGLEVIKESLKAWSVGKRISTDLYIWGAKSERKQEFYISTSIPNYQALVRYLISKEVKVGTRDRSQYSVGIRADLRAEGAVSTKVEKVLQLVVMHLLDKVEYDEIEAVEIPRFEEEVLAPAPVPPPTTVHIERGPHHPRIEGVVIANPNGVSWEIPSRRNPNERWVVVRDERHGYSCNCPSWVYDQRGDRTCRHTDLVRAFVNQPVSGETSDGDTYTERR